MACTLDSHPTVEFYVWGETEEFRCMCGRVKIPLAEVLAELHKGPPEPRILEGIGL